MVDQRRCGQDAIEEARERALESGTGARQRLSQEFFQLRAAPAPCHAAVAESLMVGDGSLQRQASEALHLGAIGIEAH
jgi:hypothetical protein